jgi:hypothetical protein
MCQVELFSINLSITHRQLSPLVDRGNLSPRFRPPGVPAIAAAKPSSAQSRNNRGHPVDGHG